MRLYGVVEHSGSYRDGHYIAYTRGGGPNSWHRFSDSKVSRDKSALTLVPSNYSMVELVPMDFIDHHFRTLLTDSPAVSVSSMSTRNKRLATSFKVSEGDMVKVLMKYSPVFSECEFEHSPKDRHLDHPTTQHFLDPQPHQALNLQLRVSKPWVPIFGLLRSR